MKVSNAASPPQLEFLTHRRHCPSEMSKRELLRSSSSLWVNKVRHDIQENPKVSKTKRDCVLPGQIWSEGKEEKAFGPCEERVVKGNFYFIVMLFQHNSESPAFLEGKKLKSQIIAEKLKLNKQNTDPHSQKWISVNFLFDPLNF